MNHARPLVRVGLACLLLSPGCKDIIEADLAGYGVVLLTPPDGYISTANLSAFRWEAIPGADAYRIQIAEPNFTNPVIYRYDSLVSGTTFDAPLQPGVYRWRVRGENPNSSTSYYERGLVIEESTTLEGSSPLLIGPTSGAITAADPIMFSWEALNGAEDYRFELRSGSQTGSLVTAMIVGGTSIELNIPEEGPYTWGVQAQNSTSSSNFSYWALTVDRTAPGTPILQEPINAIQLPNAPFTFRWTTGSNAGSGASDSLFVVDAGAQVIRSIHAPAPQVTDSLGGGTYTWYVRTTDAAGNGTSSGNGTFSIQ
ncbi:MAG: hypothetical protein KDC00_11090 [Flavobacteriales bacterium]|nr:hypothetical protein [Flavobacteriales bacterium]